MLRLAGGGGRVGVEVRSGIGGWLRMVDRLFEGQEAVLRVMGWVGRLRRRGRFVDVVCLSPRTRSCT